MWVLGKKLDFNKKVLDHAQYFATFCDLLNERHASLLVQKLFSIKYLSEITKLFRFRQMNRRIHCVFCYDRAWLNSLINFTKNEKGIDEQKISQHRFEFRLWKEGSLKVYFMWLSVLPSIHRLKAWNLFPCWRTNLRSKLHF